MKNKFDDILNANVEDKTKKEEDSSVKRISRDEALEKIKHRRKKKRVIVKKKTFNNPVPNVQKAAKPVKDSSVSKEEKVDKNEPVTEKESSVISKNEVEKPKSVTKKEEKVNKDTEKTPSETSKEEEGESQSVTEEPSEEIAIPLDIDLDDITGNEKPEKEKVEKVEDKVEEPVSEPTKKKETKKVKKEKKKTSKNIDFKKFLIPSLTFLSVFIIIGIVLYSIASDIDIKNDDNLNTKVSVNNSNSQYDVNKDTKSLLMEKSINEGFPVNYYVLLEDYNPKFNDSGYVLVDKLFTEASHSSVTSYEVNGVDYKATAVISSWAIQTDSQQMKSLIEDRMPSIRVAIETALYNKDDKFYSNEESMMEVVSFAVERVVGEKLNVKLVSIEGNFK